MIFKASVAQALIDDLNDLLRKINKDGDQLQLEELFWS
jgi:hypothetical protein